MEMANFLLSFLEKKKSNFNKINGNSYIDSPPFLNIKITNLHL